MLDFSRLTGDCSRQELPRCGKAEYCGAALFRLQYCLSTASQFFQDQIWLRGLMRWPHRAQPAAAAAFTPRVVDTAMTSGFAAKPYRARQPRAPNVQPEQANGEAVSRRLSGHPL
jgi:hypothetical protein